jgi:assimilatory nitrate reductase catalytic subunit
MSRTGVVPRLHAHAPEPAIEMHPRDMERRGIVDGDLVRLKGKRGSLLLRAAASNTLRPAQTYRADALGRAIHVRSGCECPDPAGH